MSSTTPRGPFSARERAPTLHRLASTHYDLAVIGGGITGAGVARDAASRGLKVALIEGHDFASGTSSRSSKLIHGGIRYLENFEFHLVFEALSERQRLFELAPHLVHPLRFLLPVYKTGRVPAWKMGLGMWVYDALSLFEAPELNQVLDIDDLRAGFPALQTKDLVGAFAYYDAYMDDDRLVHETLRSAHALGADQINYVRAVDVEFSNQKVSGLVCRDELTGQTFVLRARHTVSSVGPWTDRLGSTLFKAWRPTLRPSKGVHLTFHRNRFPLQDAVVMGAESRIVFAIPRHDMVIVGTTDTDYPGDPSQVRAEPADVQYLLEVVTRYFPGARLSALDILGAYAGVRPLIHDGAESEGKTSREHAIWTEPHGVTFVAGGKYTTYRNMAEQTVEEVLGHFNVEERVRYGQSQTLVPLNPLVTEAFWDRARREHTQWATRFDLSSEITAELAERHGLEALDVIEAALPLLGEARDDEEWMWWAEALHAIDHTCCRTLADFYFRRTHLILARADHGLPLANGLAKVMGQRLDWDPERQLAEINALQKQIAWDLAATISG